MYEQFYGFDERPFSITPDPRFVFLSGRHQDALAHLLYGVGTGGSGGFVQLTGEVGTGKTTLCRLMLEQVPEHTHIALILNPMLDPRELLRAICRELQVDVDEDRTGLEELNERLNRRLLEIHGAGERAVLIVDEAQNMSRETLEQVRLLTNLETATDKLLQIILLGQPELRELLSRPSLRQLAQRITARYHLAPLGKPETAGYVRHRLRIAGGEHCPFSDAALAALHQVSGGVPRLINIIADRALMAGYARETTRITPALVRQAAAEVVVDVADRTGRQRRWTAALAVAAVALVLAVSGAVVWSLGRVPTQESEAQQPVWRKLLDEAAATPVWGEAAALLAGVDAAALERACAAGGGDGLACQRLRGNWSLLRRLQRPVMLSLEGEPGALLVLEVGAAEVLIRHRGQDFRVPIAELEPRWLGGFTIAWPDDRRVFERGDRDARVRELKRHAAADPIAPWAGTLDEVYSEAFSDWVRAFQLRHELRDDGLAGPVTRLFLELVKPVPAVTAAANGGGD
ncbi:MAG: AAA family ATPase [Wenzhouxiangellaceae bacterium]|nr:AAA family ATPase [Wenzhouxiangellaceae bacterium]